MSVMLRAAPARRGRSAGGGSRREWGTLGGARSHGMARGRGRLAHAAAAVAARARSAREWGVMGLSRSASRSLALVCERVCRAAGRGGARSARERRRGAHGAPPAAARCESGEFGRARGTAAGSGACVFAQMFIYRGDGVQHSCGHTIETTPVPVKLPKLSSFWRS